jgi:ABC-type transporter Mla MlaB component
MVMEGDKKVAFQYPPQLIEAATAFASGEFALTKTTIINLIKQKESAEKLIPCWEAWFEYLLSTGDKTNFDNASVTFATKFGRSGPTWVKQWSLDEITLNDSSATASLEAEKKPIIWLCQNQLEAQDVLSFARSLANTQSRFTIVLNWSELKTIATDAIDALSFVIHQIADQSWMVKSINHQQILKIIQEQLQTSTNSQLSQSWWLLKLALLRLMNQMEIHAQACIDFCIAFDETAPSWKAPRSKFSIFDLPYLSEDGVLASVSSSNFHSTQLTKFDEMNSSIQTNSQSSANGARFVVAGILVGDITPIIKTWHSPAQTQKIVLDCQNLIRIDPTAAAILLSWIRKQNRDDIIIHMNQLHRLLAIYLFSIGLSVKNKINLLKL